MGDFRAYVANWRVLLAAQHRESLAAWLRETGLNRYLLAMTNIRGAICPVFSLATLFGHNPTGNVSDVLSRVDELNAAIVTTRRGDIAFVVDRLIAEIDVIVKPLSEGLDKMQVFQGATILGDGSIALIIDAAQLDTLIGIDVQQESLAVFSHN